MAHGTAACRLGASMRDVFRSAEADTLVAAPLTADRAPRRRGASAPGWQPPVVFVTCIRSTCCYSVRYSLRASAYADWPPVSTVAKHLIFFMFLDFSFYYAIRDRSRASVKVR
jgi:hypothetical protein